jgi:AcrR family transcriptional regulator
MAKAKRRSSTTGEETRARILDATLATLQAEGIVGASARTIARTGDFNQALIFYHFGSVDEAIVAAVGELSRRRLERYRGPLLGATSLTELIEVARHLFEHDRTSGEVTVLAQAFAGAMRDPDMGPALFEHILTWNELIAEVVERAIEASPLGGSPIASMVPREQLAMAISALFLGVEMIGGLDPRRADTDAMFTSIAAVAQLAEGMLRSAMAQVER